MFKRRETNKHRADIAGGMIGAGMSLGLTPDETGQVFQEADDLTLNALTFVWTGVADSETARTAANKLRGKKQPRA